MIRVTLPDGSSRHFDQPVSARDVACAIHPGLAYSMLAARVDDVLVDAGHRLDHDCHFQVITDKDEAALGILRHSCAHLLAQAVKTLFPSAQVTIGPVIEHGFYYDFAYDRPFTPDDLATIEAEMERLAKADLPITRRTLSHADAIAHFNAQGEHYKVELIRNLPEDADLSLYRQGDFEDLCRGPHIPSTGRLKAFKLTRVSGAYWRGDQRNTALQRIYGTCWASRQDLQAHLTRLAEAQKRDHRKLGSELGLFRFESFAPGAVFWLPKGWTLFQQLLGYMRQRQETAGYFEINTPDVMDRALWERSGHWSNYRDNMFTTQTEDERVFALKPMNCPGAVALFASGLKSYRDLPLRLAEFGKVHRYEPSGALHGLMRVRHFTQDDAHIFCTRAQMQEESERIIALVFDIYRDFGFSDITVKLSTRPANRIGNDETWDLLEAALSGALQARKIDYRINPGEGAFYGPKLEFVLRDAIGRDWQCGTLQVDLNLPERFDLSYVDEQGERQQPVMLHRALFGSLERFIGILIEHHSGALPGWLSPVQAVILNISDTQADYAASMRTALKARGIRVDADLRNEKINLKIREHTLQKTPWLLITGDREMADGTVAIRTRDGQQLGAFTVDEAANFLIQHMKVVSP